MANHTRSSALLAAMLGIAQPAAAQTFAGDEIVSNAAADIATAVATRRAELEQDHRAIVALVDTSILPHFDMQRGSRAILARRWESLAPADRDRFVTAFYDYLVASYGDLLSQFTPDTLRVLPFEGDPTESPAHVRTILTLTDGTKVDVDFVMIGSGAEWRVVDIFAEGVSYVKSYRSQFNDMAIDGFENVFDWLKEKTAPRTTAPPVEAPDPSQRP